MDTSRIRKIIRQARGPVFLAVTFSSVFFVILFPTGDLGDLVSSKVSEITQNQVFLQFNNFSLNMTPPGVEFEEVFVETAFSPGISADDITISPSIPGLIAQKPYGSVKAKGLLDGSVQVALKKGQTTEAGIERHRLILEAEQLNLSLLRDLMKWSIAMEGRLNLNADGQAELGLSEQPDLELTLGLEKFSLPPATINTMMGPMTLPDLKFGDVQLKGRLSNGKFNIETANIGKKQDDLHGKLKGFWNVSVLMIGSRPMPQFGAYDIEVDLVASKAFQAKAGLYLGLIDQFKLNDPEGARYRFKVSAADLLSPPSITGTR